MWLLSKIFLTNLFIFKIPWNFHFPSILWKDFLRNFIPQLFSSHSSEITFSFSLNPNHKQFIKISDKFITFSSLSFVLFISWILIKKSTLWWGFVWCWLHFTCIASLLNSNARFKVRERAINANTGSVNSPLCQDLTSNRCSPWSCLLTQIQTNNINKYIILGPQSQTWGLAIYQSIDSFILTINLWITWFFQFNQIGFSIPDILENIRRFNEFLRHGYHSSPRWGWSQNLRIYIIVPINFLLNLNGELKIYTNFINLLMKDARHFFVCDTWGFTLFFH